MDWLRSLFAQLTVFDRRSRALLRYRYFYHLTSPTNVESIFSNGLDPDRAEPNLRGPYTNSYVCLTTKYGINTVLQQNDTRTGGLPEFALIQVPSFALTSLAFDVDQSHDPIRDAVHGDGFCSAYQISDLLSSWHYIVVLDAITPNHLRKIDIAPYLSAYQNQRA